MGDDGKKKTFNVQEVARGSGVDIAATRTPQQGPTDGAVMIGNQTLPANVAALLNQNKIKEPDDDDAPAFLSRLERMKVSYQKAKGRASGRTLELLEGADLDDLVKMVSDLQFNDGLRRHADARLRGRLFVTLKEEPGPLLLGMNDERLAQPWLLFDQGWDVWAPEADNEFDDGGEGVELFWEGEAEDDEGNDIEVMQSLAYKKGDVRLITRFGELEDDIRYDGEAFYRLKDR